MTHEKSFQFPITKSSCSKWTLSSAIDRGSKLRYCLMELQECYFWTRLHLLQLRKTQKILIEENISQECVLSSFTFAILSLVTIFSLSWSTVSTGFHCFLGGRPASDPFSSNIDQWHGYFYLKVKLKPSHALDWPFDCRSRYILPGYL